MLAKIKGFLVFCVCQKNSFFAYIFSAWEVWHENKLFAKMNSWDMSKEAAYQLFQKRLHSISTCMIIGSVLWGLCIQPLALELFKACELPNYSFLICQFISYEILVNVCNDLV